MPHPRILIIEDHPLMADAIAASVQTCVPQAQCCVVSHLSSACDQLTAEQTWALVLVDLNLPDSHGLATLEAVCELRPQGALLVLSALQAPSIEQACLANGVLFINKALPSRTFMAALLSALQQILPPGCAEEPPRLGNFQSLSAQQRLVLVHLSQGWTSRHIAQQMHLSEATVRSHTREVLRKLGVDNRTQASQLYLQWVQQQLNHA